MECGRNLFPEFEGALLTELFKHQLVAVSWMKDRENVKSKELPHFYKKTRSGKYLHEITRHEYDSAPDNIKGGILSDAMGLGKSLSILGLIVANPPPRIVYGRKQRQQQYHVPSTNSLHQGTMETDTNEISELTGKKITPTLGRTIFLSQQYGTEAGAGGFVDWKKGSISVVSGSQEYDLNALYGEASESGKAIEMKKVYHEAPAAAN